jgi:phage recombination protein Bet
MQLQPVKNDLAYFTPEKLEFLRKHYAQTATPEEFEHFVEVARSRQLRPDAKQIYFIKIGGRASIVLSIDAYRLIAQRTGCYMGISPVQITLNDQGKPVSATITVKRLVSGQLAEFSGTALYAEHYRSGKDGKQTLWDTMPATMLEKCAEAKALRKAFPEELSGYYTIDEMDGAESQQKPIEVEPIIETQKPETKRWIQSKLKDAGVPEPEWDSIIESLNGYPKGQLLTLLKRELESRKTSA